MNISQYARGTSSYRAPELSSDKPSFNNKTDIWALGCVLYELVTGQKRFTDDWAVRDYIQSLLEESPIPFPHAVDPLVKEQFASVIASALNKNPSERPSTSALRQRIMLCIKELQIKGVENTVSQARQLNSSILLPPEILFNPVCSWPLTTMETHFEKVEPILQRARQSKILNFESIFKNRLTLVWVDSISWIRVKMSWLSHKSFTASWEVNHSFNTHGLWRLDNIKL